MKVYLAGGEAVTVTAESGVFTATGDFDATNKPALVERLGGLGQERG